VVKRTDTRVYERTDEEAVTVETSREQLTQVVDDALVRFRGRDLVSSAEVLDVLLDLRLLLLEVESLELLLEEPAPAGGGTV
jgi:hypothetical protein